MGDDLSEGAALLQRHLSHHGAVEAALMPLWSPSSGQVARANLPVADLRLHAAIVFAARSMQPEAQNELAAALKLNPSLEKSDEVRQLRIRLGAAAPRGRK